MVEVLQRIRDAITGGEIRCKSDGWEYGDVNTDLLDDVVEMHTEIGKWIVRLGGVPNE